MNATSTGGLGRALLDAVLLSVLVGGSGAAALAQENPSTAPHTDAPSQIQTPDGPDDAPAGGSDAAVSYFSEPRAMYATTSSRVRSGPGTNHAPVGTIPYAGEVSVLGESSNSAWLYVETGDGLQGFTAASLLSSVRPTASTGGGDGSGDGTGDGAPSTPSCVAGQVLIQMGDGRAICAYLQ